MLSLQNLVFIRVGWSVFEDIPHDGAIEKSAAPRIPLVMVNIIEGIPIVVKRHRDIPSSHRNYVDPFVCSEAT